MEWTGRMAMAGGGESGRETAHESAGDGAQRRSIVLTANRIDSRDLFSATREITIGHGSEVYRLRLTAHNKLILTK